MKKRLIALLLAVATMLSLMGSAAPTMIGESAVSESAVDAAASYDYSAYIEKKAQFNPVYLSGGSFPISADPASEESWSNANQMLSNEVSPELIVVVKNVIVVEARQEVWFEIVAADGYVLPEAMNGYSWVYQYNVGDADAYGSLLIIEEPAVQCPVCGEENCDKEHVFCDICGKYDCGVNHAQCPICGELGCDGDHVYCSVCGKYDCGVDHNVSKPPMTAPVIPAYTLPEDMDSAIVDGNGTVAPGTGFVLAAGKQMSLSAWTHLENASYKWQIRYDHENDLWTDIQGKTGKGILFSAAMLLSTLNEYNMAYLRFVASNGTEEITSDAVAVTVRNYTSVSSGGSDTEAVALDLPEAQAEEDVPELRSYSVIINYVFENNETAADPYTATLAAGSNFSATVTHPTIMGYLPYIGTEIETSTQVNVTDIQANVTYTVTYKPTNMNYTVIHYQQNVDNDKYTIAHTETKQGLTGSAVPKVAAEYPGFYALLYEHPAIAADGSTVVEVYYDRYYYLVKFDLSGGYGVEPVYDRYGAELKVDTPTRPGYVFDGWSLDGATAVSLPNTVPAKNTTYIALWTPLNTEYSVVYWVQNDDGTKTYIGTKIEDALSGNVVSGSDDLTINTNTCGMPAHTHNATCVLSCALTEHTHGDGCLYTCNQAYHDHRSGCNYNCGKTAHAVHARNCYTFTSGATIATSTSNVNNAVLVNTYNGLAVYRNGNNGQYRYVLINGAYYRITNYGNNLNANDLTYNLKDELHVHEASCCSLAIHDHSDCECRLTAHLHGAGCYSCKSLEHTHSNACKSDLAKYVDFVIADENVTVAGDGSSVVNVYYKYRTYTIRYIYAKRNGTNYQVATLTNDGRLDNCQWANSGSTKLPTVTDPDGKTGNNTVVIDGVTYYYISLTAKFGENIANKWPGGNVGNFGNYTWGSWAAAAGTGYRNTYGNEHANIVGPYPVMSADMIVDNPQLLETRTDGTKVYLAQNMIAWWAGSNNNVANHAYHNYFELLPGETQVAGQTYKTYNGKTYKLVETYTFTAAHNGTTRVDPIYFNGYKCVNDTSGTSNDSQSNSNNFNNNWNCSICGNACRYCNDFFYDRNEHKLYFWNRNGYLREGSGAEIVYGENLTKYGTYVDEAFMNLPENYPEGLEPGAYKFGGWYTTADCLDGTEMNWNATMPDSDMTVYAKWVPVTRTVRFFLDKADMEAGKTIPEKTAELYAATHNGAEDSNSPYKSYTTITDIRNNSYLNDISVPGVSPGYENHPYSSYTSVGWFYVDENGDEKAFDPANMPVTRDLDLYHKWSSNVLTEYSVFFKLQGTNTEIADSIIGSALAGATKSFDAKGGLDLYADYRVGYFPLVKSHSLTLNIDDESQNTFTFWYVQKDAVPYSVYYVTDQQNDGGNLPEIQLDGKTYYIVADTYTDSDNRKAVVTEKFVPVQGYMPDAYQKRLVVDGTDDAVNKIIFFYTKDTQHAYYKITHYTQNTDGETWAEYASSEVVGDIGKTYSADPLTIDGFTYDSTVEGTVVSGVLTGAGLELKLYYTRNKYPFEVRYLEKGTGKQLAEPKSGRDFYGKVISESAIDIANYAAVDPASQTLTVKIEESQTEAKLNIITFYYEKALANLTITKTVAQDIDENQSFIFDVTGPNGFAMTVVINGNSSVTIKDLPIATYTVTERTNWSWRYTPKDEEIEKTLITDSAQNEVVFENTRSDIFWLNGGAYAKNLFDGSV